MVDSLVGLLMEKITEVLEIGPLITFIDPEGLQQVLAFLVSVLNVSLFRLIQFYLLCFYRRSCQD